QAAGAELARLAVGLEQRTAGMDEVQLVLEVVVVHEALVPGGHHDDVGAEGGHPEGRPHPPEAVAVAELVDVAEGVRHAPRIMPVVRLNAYLARAGVASRRGADELIKAGRVRVNGEPGALNTFVEPGDRAELEGRPDEAALRRLAEGVELEDGRTAPARVRRLGPSTVELAIHEGRKHQVKRMLEAVGHPVTRLHRSRYAGLTVAGLDPGES